MEPTNQTPPAPRCHLDPIAGMPQRCNSESCEREHGTAQQIMASYEELMSAFTIPAPIHKRGQA